MTESARGALGGQRDGVGGKLVASIPATDNVASLSTGRLSLSERTIRTANPLPMERYENVLESDP